MSVLGFNVMLKVYNCAIKESEYLFVIVWVNVSKTLQTQGGCASKKKISNFSAHPEDGGSGVPPTPTPPKTLLPIQQTECAVTQ